MRFLHYYLYGEIEKLKFANSDQKPCWFTAAALLKTLALKGQNKVAVKENVPLTRMRFTTMTRCTWPEPPPAHRQDGERKVAFLFKADNGARIREALSPYLPDDCLLQFGPAGSYRTGRPL